MPKNSAAWSQPSLEEFWNAAEEAVHPQQKRQPQPPVAKAQGSLFDITEPEPAVPAPRPVATSPTPVATPPTVDGIVSSEQVFRPKDQDDLAPSGVRARLSANLAALSLMRRLQSEERAATLAEKTILSRWGGWGAQGLSAVFDEKVLSYATERARLKTLLDDTEYAAARRTTLTAHYTDPEYVKQIWATLQGLGFNPESDQRPTVLEPGCGAGTFIGLAPEHTSMVGVELDPTTAAIAQLVYPEAAIRAESFADTRYPLGWFDAAVGNVPFAQISLDDPDHNPDGRLSIHNHFIVKSLDLTKPGGLVAMLTSHHTMDAQNPEARRMISERADLVGAVRLPSGAHKRAAGTEVVTDLLILRKREPGTPAVDTSWVATRNIELPGTDGQTQHRVNEYFVNNPAHVLGDMSIQIGLYGAPGLHVIPTSQTPELETVLAGIVTQATEQGLVYDPTPPSIKNHSKVKVVLDEEIDGHIRAESDGSFTIRDQGVYRALTHESGRAVVPQNRATEMRHLLHLRDLARELITKEASYTGENPAIEDLRHQLKTSWDTYTTSYGPINRFTARPDTIDEDGNATPGARIMSPTVKVLIEKDPFGPLVLGLEHFDEDTQTAKPAALLLERQVRPRQPVLGTEDPFVALQVTLDTHGTVDIGNIAHLLDTSEETAISMLGDLVFALPDAQEPTWVTAAEYLSGNVRAKLATARAAAEDDPSFAVNVRALAEVMPVDLTAGDITPKLGAIWIPAADYQLFIRELLDDPRARVTHTGGSRWRVDASDWSTLATQQWGTSQMPAGDIIENLMKQKPIQVTMPNPVGTKPERVIDPEGTLVAQGKADEIEARFEQWIWENPNRTERLVAEYNKRFNSTVLRDYTRTSAHLQLPGLVSSFKPMPHQLAAIARQIAEPSVGLFHGVGAGKTAEMVIGTMELKRLGMVNKPCVVVPRHMLGQFTREWTQLYPSAKILSADSVDTNTANRRAFVARTAMNDWDAIIMTQEAFRAIPLSRDAQDHYLTTRLSEMRTSLERANAERVDPRSIKSLERSMASMETWFTKKVKGIKHDEGVTFEQTGIDRLVVDEFHHFKNLDVMSSIPDVAKPGVMRAVDMDMKINHLRNTFGGRVLTTATATPIANSVAEMYVMQRYHDPQALLDAGIADFDSWAATFGKIVTGFEADTTGTKMKLKTRFASFNNVPELLTMFNTFADVKTTQQLQLAIPALTERADGRRAPNPLIVAPTQELLAHMQQLSQRVDAISSRSVTPDVDNMLKVTGSGRLAALDMRLVTPQNQWGLLDTTATKVEAAADKLYQKWVETRDLEYLDATGQISPTRGGLQVVFCDQSTPNKDKPWNVYEALRSALYARGLPAGSVRFIHEVSKPQEREQLFARCRSGHVAVLIGSTEKMGTGVNIQNRLTHMLHMDAPWRPCDVEQREGRGVRQGNQNKEIEITRMVTERSFDTYNWQILERKARFVDQIMSGNAERQIEDIGDVEMGFAELKALASANPLLLEEATAKAELQKLQAKFNHHQLNQRSLRSSIDIDQEFIPSGKHIVHNIRKLDERTIDTSGERFSMSIQGRKYIERASAAEALSDLVKSWGTLTIFGTRDLGVIATVGGHDIRARHLGPDIILDLAELPDTVTSNLKVQELDTVGLGLVARMEKLPTRLQARIQALEMTIEETEQRLKASLAQLGQPFPHQEALATARATYEGVQAKMIANDQLDTNPDQPASPEPTTHQAPEPETNTEPRDAVWRHPFERASIQNGSDDHLALANEWRRAIPQELWWSLGAQRFQAVPGSHQFGGMVFDAKVLPFTKTGQRSTVATKMAVMISVTPADEIDIEVRRYDGHTHAKVEGIYISDVPKVLLSIDYDGEQPLNPRYWRTPEEVPSPLQPQPIARVRDVAEVEYTVTTAKLIPTRSGILVDEVESVDYEMPSRNAADHQLYVEQHDAAMSTENDLGRHIR